nr:MAG TPA: hypothetical protein [Caudoviricetes sp.]
MRKTSVHSLKICKIVPTFLFVKVGFDQFEGKFWSLYGRKISFLAKKSGQKPGFANQKWAEKIGCIF